MPTYWRIGLEWVSIWVLIRIPRRRSERTMRSHYIRAMDILRNRRECDNRGNFMIYYQPPRANQNHYVVVRVEVLRHSEVSHAEAARTLALAELRWRVENS
ncbi:hypothetical protein FE257_008671 [Aspergillus nanangensis]|uniref:Uncharacterized protein n=1 Tax=Aspergillus nanangensis TaxID=2582783 RepID=A0AAD4CMB8_ASPNN|nr:hypothetical protein FE257_008671 [Aspergillus nanangensis]